MSDPVTNVEIEDVLSSIRRLVSVDSGRSKRKPKPDMGAGSQPKHDNKLVLTDDLRIPPEPELVSQEQLKDLTEDYTKTLERRIAELESAVNAQANEYEPDGSEDTTQHRPTSVLFPAKPDAEATSRDDGVLQLDVLVDEDLAETAEAPETVNRDAALADELAEPDQDEAAQPEATESNDNETADADVAHDDMWSDDVSGSTSQNTADDTVEIFEAESHRKDAEKAVDGEFVFSNDDTVIDEEALRDMVAEIVREELQGALGERITRNVRKLVRREIMRAISIRDFE